MSSENYQDNKKKETKLSLDALRRPNEPIKTRLSAHRTNHVTRRLFNSDRRRIIRKISNNAHPFVNAINTLNSSNDKK